MAMSEMRTPFPVVRAANIPVEKGREPWLIDQLWGASSAGVLGGPPKACKSWLALDMAVSVATGTPCLGHFDVPVPGPALVYMAEDSLPAVRERLLSIAHSRRLCLSDVNVHVITTPVIRLDHEADRIRLLETTHRVAPRLLVLDPLVRLHQVDENHATAVAELLSYLRTLQRRLGLAVVLVHHARKNGNAQGGVALRGSSDIWAFGDSNLYLRRDRDVLKLSMEHRTAASPPPVTLRLSDRYPIRVHLEVVDDNGDGDDATGPSDLHTRVLDALRRLNARTRDELRTELRVRNERLGAVLRDLIDQGKITRGLAGLYFLGDREPTLDSHSPPIEKDGTGTRI